MNDSEDPDLLFGPRFKVFDPIQKAKISKEVLTKKMHTELTDEELETYSRQIVLADIGYDGQLKLRNAKVCLIGIGGLGAPVATQLVGMGIGHLRIVDRDIVSRSDLHRQHLYDAECVGMPKVDSACDTLAAINPDVAVITHRERITAVDALGLPYTTLGYRNGPGYTGATAEQPEGPKHIEP